MPNIAAVFREEMTRLARKEVKAKTESMRKSIAQYRHDIASMKRRIAEQRKEIDFLKGREAKRIKSGPDPKASLNGNVRWSARSVRSQRKRLGLSAEDFGTLIGVSPQTVYNWEQGTSRARDAQFAAFRDVRGIGRREAQRRLEVLEE